MKKADVLYSGAIGLLLGMALDYVMGYHWGMWAYNRHPYWQISYWAVLPAMWAMFGIYVTIAWRKLKPGWVTIPIMVAGHETYGVVRNSWEYSVDWPIVVIGWIPLIIIIVMLMEIPGRMVQHEAKGAQS